MPPYNKARISNFCLEFQKLQKCQIFENATSPSVLIRSLGAAASSLVARWAAESRVERSILLWGNVSSQLHLISPGCPRPNSALIVQKSGLKPVHPSLFDHSEILTGETRYIMSPYNKARISNYCLEWQKLQKFEISSKHYSSFSSYSIILKFLLEKLDI